MTWANKALRTLKQVYRPPSHCSVRGETKGWKLSRVSWLLRSDIRLQTHGLKMDLRTSRCVCFGTHTCVGECVDPGGMNYNKQQKEDIHLNNSLKPEHHTWEELICQQFEWHINSTKGADTGSVGTQKQVSTGSNYRLLSCSLLYFTSRELSCSLIVTIFLSVLCTVVGIQRSAQAPAGYWTQCSQRPWHFEFQLTEQHKHCDTCSKHILQQMLSLSHSWQNDHPVQTFTFLGKKSEILFFISHYCRLLWNTSIAKTETKMGVYI